MVADTPCRDTGGLGRPGNVFAVRSNRILRGGALRRGGAVTGIVRHNIGGITEGVGGGVVAGGGGDTHVVDVLIGALKKVINIVKKN